MNFVRSNWNFIKNTFLQANANVNEVPYAIYKIDEDNYSLRPFEKDSKDWLCIVAYPEKKLYFGNYGCWHQPTSWAIPTKPAEAKLWKKHILGEKFSEVFLRKDWKEGKLKLQELANFLQKPYGMYSMDSKYSSEFIVINFFDPELDNKINHHPLIVAYPKISYSE
jgi:hypothetical protein